MAGGDWNGELWLWSVETGQLLHPPLRGHQSGARPILLSTDGRTLCSASDDHAIRFWNVASGQEMLLFEDADPVSSYYDFAPSWGPGDRQLVWRELDGEIRVIPLPSLAEIDAGLATRR